MTEPTINGAATILCVNTLKAKIMHLLGVFCNKKNYDMFLQGHDTNTVSCLPKFGEHNIAPIISTRSKIIRLHFLVIPPLFAPALYRLGTTGLWQTPLQSMAFCIDIS